MSAGLSSAVEIADAYGRVKEEAGPTVTVVVATKYVAVEQFEVLREAGIEVVGENRAQDLAQKHELYSDAFRWQFIGHLQSNKARLVDSCCELVHSVDTETTARRLTIPWLLEVNLAGEASKSGVAPAEIPGFVEAFPLLRGLMTMPPFATDPEESRPWFRRLRALADDHGLPEVSMGTSQDWRVAVDEGATLIRVGSTILRDG